MSIVDKVQAKIRAIYASVVHRASEVPLAIRSMVYCDYADNYLEAARVLRERDIDQQVLLLMPWYQLIGQALELSMKACLAVEGISPPHTHDLVVLCNRTEVRGFSLGVEHAHALLVHLNHGYCVDLATGDRFVARYGGGSSLSVPDHARLALVCKTLIGQARDRNPMLRDGKGK